MAVRFPMANSSVNGVGGGGGGGNIRSSSSSSSGVAVHWL